MNRKLLLTLAAVGLLLLFPLSLAVKTTAPHDNQGTIKVHDDAQESPPTQNDPHVSCTFWIEGFNMEQDSGTLVFWNWPPTGDKTQVMQDNWTGTAEADQSGGFHFLNGPYTLPAGHYRVEAFSTGGHPGNDNQDSKSKMFWVDDCTPPTSTPPPTTTPPATTTPPVTTTPPPTTTPPETTTPPPTTTPPETTTPPPTTTPPETTTPPPTSTPPPTCGVGELPPCVTCPTDLSASANGDGSVTVTFTPAVGSDATNLYRAEGAGSFVLVASLSASDTSYHDTTTVAGTSYTYMVTGTFGNSESRDCATVVVTAVPDFPTPVAFGLGAGGSAVAFALLRRRLA